jgi:hypothetical protein
LKWEAMAAVLTEFGEFPLKGTENAFSILLSEKNSKRVSVISVLRFILAYRLLTYRELHLENFFFKIYKNFQTSNFFAPHSFIRKWDKS